MRITFTAEVGMVWRSFVAIGDSFTEGLDDLDETTGVFRGWADLVAMRLAEDTADLTYANLAIRGRLFDNIVDEQVPVALRMQPDLISFAAGGNDALRRGFSAPRLIGRLDTVIKTLRASSADVILFRWADVTGRLPGQRMILPRVSLLNNAVGEVASRRGAKLVDLWLDDEYRNPGLWSVDRLHMNALGHRRTAAHVLTTLGVKTDPTWLDAPPYLAPLPWAKARAADIQWTREHLTPWVKRRLAGKSSGDLVTAKRPALVPVRVDQD
jgi:lysophospholipase L1-like esterase